eukprot:35437_1
MPTHKYKIVRKNFLSYSADEFPTFDYSLTNERPELDDELSINAAVRCFLKVDDSLWVADGNGFVYIRSFSDGSLIDSFEIPRKKSDSSVRSLCNAMCLHEDLVWISSTDGCLRAWKKTGGDAVHEVAYSGGAIKTLLSHETSLWSSSDDCFLSERNRDGVVVTQLKDMDKTSRCLVIDSNHGRLWSSSKTGIHVYDRKRGLIASLRGHQGELTALLAVDGDIWSGGSDKCICIWSAETFELRRKMKAHRRPINCLHKVKDSVWSGALNDAFICIWDSKSGELRECIRRENSVFGLVSSRFGGGVYKSPSKQRIVDIASSEECIWVAYREPGSLKCFKFPPPKVESRRSSSRKNALQLDKRRISHSPKLNIVVTESEGVKCQKQLSPRTPDRSSRRKSRIVLRSDPIKKHVKRMSCRRNIRKSYDLERLRSSRSFSYSPEKLNSYQDWDKTSTEHSNALLDPTYQPNANNISGESILEDSKVSGLTQDRVIRLNQCLEEKKRALDAAEIKLEDHKEQIRKETNALKARMGDFRAEIHKVQTETYNEKDSMMSLRSELMDWESRLKTSEEKWQKERRMLCDDREVLQRSLIESRGNIKELKNRLEHERSVKFGKEKDFSDEHGIRLELEKKLRQVQAKYNVRKDTLQNDNELLEDDITTLQKKISHLESSLGDEISRSREYSARISRLSKSNNDLREASKVREHKFSVQEKAFFSEKRQYMKEIEKLYMRCAKLHKIDERRSVEEQSHRDHDREQEFVLEKRIKHLEKLVEAKDYVISQLETQIVEQKSSMQTLAGNIQQNIGIEDRVFRKIQDKTGDVKSRIQSLSLKFKDLRQHCSIEPKSAKSIDDGSNHQINQDIGLSFSSTDANLHKDVESMPAEVTPKSEQYSSATEHRLLTEPVITVENSGVQVNYYTPIVHPAAELDISDADSGSDASGEFSQTNAFAMDSEASEYECQEEQLRLEKEVLYSLMDDQLQLSSSITPDSSISQVDTQDNALYADIDPLGANIVHSLDHVHTEL